jgi:hypothetical protein
MHRFSRRWQFDHRSLVEFEKLMNGLGRSGVSFRFPIFGFTGNDFFLAHWFIIIPIAVLGIVSSRPWIRQLKWRFTLRTLLIATMLVAVVLGAGGVAGPMNCPAPITVMAEFVMRGRIAGMNAERNEPIAPELPRRKFRKLRIFWSIVFGMLYLLLVALWVRSNSWTSSAYWIYSNGQAILLSSDNGNIQFLWERNASFGNKTGWFFQQVELPAKFREARARRSWVSNRFLWESGPARVQVFIPYWLPVFLCGLASALPWLRRRYSLRAILIAAAIAAVGLGVIAWAEK